MALRGCEIVIPICPIKNAGQQSGSDRSQADSLEGEFTEVVSEGEREEDGDLRVLPEGRSEPCDNEPSFSSLIVARSCFAGPGL